MTAIAVTAAQLEATVGKQNSGLSILSARYLHVSSAPPAADGKNHIGFGNFRILSQRITVFIGRVTAIP